MTRFRTRQAALILAYLALHADRLTSRDDLAMMIYTDGNESTVRNRFRNMLWSLRRQLEPPGVESGSVLIADRQHVKLNPDAISTDVAEFKSLISALRQASSEVREKLLLDCYNLYQGELLEGYYADWAISPRLELAEAYLEVLQQLTAQSAKNAPKKALQYAHKAIEIDSTSEQSFCDLIKLYTELGKPALALKQYRLLEKVLAKELNIRPSPETRALAAAARHAKAPQELQLSEAPSEAPEGTTSQDSTFYRRRVRKIPLTMTRFFGREEELKEIRELFDNKENRLITLIGPGGCGKTRFAIESIRCLEDELAGIYFVPLADLTHPAQILDVVLRTLDIERSPGVDPYEQLEFFFSNRTGRILLIMDNLEHLLRYSDDNPTELTVRQILDSGSNLFMIATSRHHIGIEGEKEMHIGPLIVPWQEADGKTTLSKYKGQSLEALIQYPSVRMFLDRAQAIVPSFQATPRNAAAIASVCEKLEGIPLAIELAAALMQGLTPHQLLRQLNKKFEVLVSRRKDIASRHSTLYATIDYSYRQLTDDLRECLASLTVFQGGWTLDMADAVLERSCLDDLLELRERSLVIAESSEGEMRYRMLETVRDFSRAQLSPERQEALSLGHATYMASLAKDLLLGEVPAELHRLEAENENFRAALSWTLADFDTESVKQPYIQDRIKLGCRLALDVRQIWHLLGTCQEGIEWMRKALNLLGMLDEPDQMLEISLKGHIGGLLFKLARREESAEVFEKLLPEAVVAHHLEMEAYSMFMIASIQMLCPEQFQLQSEEIETRLHRALELYRELDNKQLEYTVLSTIATKHVRDGKSEEALEAFQRIVKHFEQSGHFKGAGFVYNNMACLVGLEDQDLAIELIIKSLEYRRQLGDRPGLAITLLNYGIMTLGAGRAEESIEALSEALELCLDFGNLEYLSTSYVYLAQLALETGHYHTSAIFLGTFFSLNAQPIFGSTGDGMIEKLEENLRNQLGRTYDQLVKQGANKTSDELVELVYSLKNQSSMSA